MKYVFGPVPSRRLGRSLGISPIPEKTCNYTCIYCQLGRTTHFTNTRKKFFPVEDILVELEKALEQEREIDFITIVGEGEPTLYEDLGLLISKTKNLTSKPIAVITNGALLYKEDVRKNLLEADVIMPTLDAYSEKMFRKIKIWMLALVFILNLFNAVCLAGNASDNESGNAKSKVTIPWREFKDILSPDKRRRAVKKVINKLSVSERRVCV